MDQLIRILIIKPEFIKFLGYTFYLTVNTIEVTRCQPVSSGFYVNNFLIFFYNITHITNNLWGYIETTLSCELVKDFSLNKQTSKI